jgi:N-acetylglucosamine-6-sulfatase
VAAVDAEYRQRAQAVQAVDRLLGMLEAELRARGLAGNTYIVFSSDNGYHLGQHQLLGGKESAFQTDIHVPLIITGPGVPSNRIVSRVVQNIDLNPTFVQIAGGRLRHTVEGRSLLPLLHPARGKPQPRWPTAALIEHNAVPRLILPGGIGPGGLVDPDLEPGDLGLISFPALPAAKDNRAPPTAINPRRYAAVRLFNRQFGNLLYVEYANHQHEYYNIDNDPYERINIYQQEKRKHPNRLRKLQSILIALENCHNATACWNAAWPQS